MDGNAQTFDQKTAALPAEIPADPITVPGVAVPDAPAPQIESGIPLLAVQGLCGFPFWYLANRYGKIWELSDRERTELAKAIKPVIDKYFPDGASVELFALMAVAMVVAPRMAMMQAAKKKPASAMASTRTPESAGSSSSAESGDLENPFSSSSSSDPFGAASSSTL